MKAIGSIITHGKYNTPTTNQPTPILTQLSQRRHDIYLLCACLFSPCQHNHTGHTRIRIIHSAHYSTTSTYYHLHMCLRSSVLCNKINMFCIYNSCTCRCGSHTSWRIPRSRYPEVTLHPPSATTSNPESWARSASV